MYAKNLKAFSLFWLLIVEKIDCDINRLFPWEKCQPKRERHKFTKKEAISMFFKDQGEIVNFSEFSFLNWTFVCFFWAHFTEYLIF